MTGRPPTPSWTCCSPEALDGRPKDSEWLPEMAQLAEVAVLAGHAEAAAVLYGLLSPYAHRFCVEGIGAAFTGSVHWYLALLADALGDARRGVKPRSGNAPSSPPRRPRRRSPAARAGPATPESSRRR